MAISIEDFRKSLEVGLSRDLVQKVLTKYENFDFSSVNTNNGTKLREIDSFDKENITFAIDEELRYFLNHTLKKDYFVSRGIYESTEEQPKEEQRKKILEVSEEIEESLCSRPNTLTISSKTIKNNPQRDESSHILTINTDSASIVSILDSLYYNLSRYDIPFDIEIPRFSLIDKGYTEAIKLHVPTMDLEDTIKAIAKLDKKYKDKIKKPNMFNANIQDIFGYDSVIDINGTRASDLLGVAIIKGLDKTLVDLAKDETIDNLSVVEYLKNAENKDEARKRVIEKVKVNTPNIIDPVLINSLQVIKEEKLAIDPDNVFVSDMAASELNAEFGTLEDEIINFNEIEEVKEEEKTSNVIQKAVSSVAAGVKSVKDLFSNQYIQPEIPFGSINLGSAVEENVTTNEPSDELKVENPTVTVVEPLEKTSELQELSEPQLDTIDENVQPVYTGDENKVTEDFVLPGEEDFVEPQPVVEEPIETVATETVEPKDVVPIVAPSAASVDVNPTIENTEVPESKGTETVLTNMDYIKTLEEPYRNSFDVSENVEVPVVETTEAVETPVVEEAVSVPVEDTSEVEVQQATDTSMISEPVVPAEEPVVQDDTQVDLEKTQILQPVEVVSQVEAPKPELPSGIKEIITPQVNPVPEFKPEEHVEAPVQPVVEPVQPLEAEAQELKNEVEQQLNTLQNAEVDTRTIEIPTEEIKEEGSDILSAISSNLEVPDSSKLSTEEKIAVVADTFTKTVDPVRQAKIDKYNGIFLDNQVLDFQVRDTNSEIIMKEDGTPYTFLDYLENNDVLSKIQLDSKYYIKDDPSRDYVDGKTFIREFVIPNSVNGNRSIEDILDWYVKSVTNINEQPKKKGFFSFGRK